MCNLQCILALAAISTHAAYSWEIATTVDNQLHFYNERNLSSTVGGGSRELTALAYDAVYNMMLFVDKNSDNASIFSLFLSNNTYKPLVKRRSHESIVGLAFDPIENRLFWTDDSEKSIFEISLRNDSKYNGYGKVFLKLNNEIPQGIAVDSCRKYVYWSNTKMGSASIKRARFDDNKIEVIINSSLTMPISIAIDQRTKRLFWADDTAGANYVIESSNLDGSNRVKLIEGTDHRPIALTVSKDFIYWFDQDYHYIWRIPKEPTPQTKPEKYMPFTDKDVYGIATNYPIEDQTEGIPECYALRDLLHNKPEISNIATIPVDTGLFCIHGEKTEVNGPCKCAPGYTGVRCDINVCQNYCLKGNCSLNADDKPQCSCTPGYIGERCEINVCYGYCLNNGKCSLNKQQEPECSCDGFEGMRCEVQIVKTTTAAFTESTRNYTESCNCTQNAPIVPTECFNKTPTAPTESLVSNEKQFLVITECNDGWNSTRDPIIIVLSIICTLLCAACGLLLRKVIQLKRRPRIKKRIIVNKNVTPMTARPDQCEVTIENCCNMNICETPCFEPRSTIRPSLLDSKPGKEENKNLISHMELPDDY
ncbi:hypothetical protein K1T71_005968 [Dendrolimus kikuchii]|uniref:Uncharacterized protein n=1 Tax=Dendrolimus kikuchii TaxID=765133 RepID=A0ACC1D319_9NEOP|nr:hypothetical protein K1T71_005968 [Dendrolimus kikuchii]